MKLGFILFKYFPFGGLQRDFMHIARACQKRGHDIVVYTLSWQGERPRSFEIRVLPVRALENHSKYAKFHSAAMREIESNPVDRLVGFNKMPGLDFYYMADACYQHKARDSRGRLYRLSPRYALFRRFEAAVFDRGKNAQILMLSDLQRPFYQRFYHTEEERFHLLPPGIARDRRRSPDSLRMRQDLRQSLHLTNDDYLMLLVGSGFKTKGLDRALLAFRALPESVRKRTHFIAIGQDNPRRFLKQARRLQVSENFRIITGRSDIPNFLAAADLLIHPAYHESAGIVLLEAIASGLPVLASAVCGYGHYVSEAGAGYLLDEPFRQDALDGNLLSMLTATPKEKKSWQENALAFAESANIYSMPEAAADIILGDQP